MSNPILSRITQGVSGLPPRVLLSGPEGIGKSTFGSKAPSPLFICAEDGLTGLDFLNRYVPTSLDDLHSMLDGLIADPKPFENVVIDTTDWLERFITQGVCARDAKKDIEEYGYGKGYVMLENELVKILQKLDLIRTKHKVGIILLSHVQIRTHNDPGGESWDRYEMKGHKRFTGVLREWPDACLFAVIPVFKKKIKGENEKAVSGERVIKTEWSPAWDAKNRLSLPPEIPLEWSEFQKAVIENSPATLAKRVIALHSTATKIPDDQKSGWDKWVKKLASVPSDKLKAAIENLEKLQ